MLITMKNALDLSDEAIGLTDVHLLALYMGHGRWSDQRVTGINLTRWSNVTYLSLENQDIPPDEVGRLLDSLAHNQTLTALNLNGVNGMGGYADEDDYFIPALANGKKLAKVIEKHKKLVYLTCKYCHMGMRALTAIGKALEKNTTLTALNLGNNTWWWDEHTDELLSDQNFNATGIKDLAKGLCLHNSTLVYIEILSLRAQHLLLSGSGYAINVYELEEQEQHDLETGSRQNGGLIAK